MFGKKTRWICAGERFQSMAEAAQDRVHEQLCMLARRIVKLPKRMKSASLRMSADDYCNLYLNGQFVCQGPFSCYPQQQYVTETDVLKYLKPGENVIALQVYYDGSRSPSRFSGDGRQGFILELDVDGETVLCSNDRFRILCPPGDSFGYENGVSAETLDARVFPGEWTLLKYDDASWHKPFIKKNADYDFVPQPVKPDLFVEFGVSENESGIYDLEDGYTGVLTVQANGSDGSCISFYDADAEKRLLYRLVLGGSSTVTFSLPQRLHRIRTETEGECRIEKLTARVFRYAEGEDALSVKTASEVLHDRIKRLKSALLNDDKVAFDLQRNDADEGILALAATYLTGDDGFLRMMTSNMALSQSRVKTLLTGAPCAIACEDHVSSLKFAYHAYLCWQHTGDRELLETLKNAANGVLRAFGTYARRDGLLESTGEGGEKQCFSRLNAIYIGALLSYEKMCAELGTECAIHSKPVLKAFNDAFYDADRCLYVDAQGSDACSREGNVFPVFFGFAPAECREKAKPLLLAPGDRKDEYYRLKALSLCGARNEAASQVLSGGTHSPESETAVFIEDVLSVNPSVLGGGVWSNCLPKELGSASVRVKAFGKKVLFTRNEDFVILKY